MDDLHEFINYAVSPGPLTVEDIKVLHGANYFSGEQVVRFRINLGDYDEVFTDAIPGFFAQLKSQLPGLYHHHCSPGKPGGFFERIRRGTLLGHVMEHVAIELQNMAGMDVGFGKTREAKKQGVYNVVFRFFDEIAGIYAGKAALNLLNAMLESKPFDINAVIEHLVWIREKRLLGPSTQAIVDEAARRNIPVIRVDKYNLVQLGTGKYRKLTRATMTQDTSVLAVETTDDKYLTNTILEEAGIPVPQQIITEKLDEVLAFHARLQRAIVVKPAQGYQGKRVSIDLNTPEAITQAFAWARDFHEEIIAQEDIPGGTYRILLINYQPVAAVRLTPPKITGNGIQTIAELTEVLNLDPLREYGDKGKLTKVEIDEETLHILSLMGLEPDSVLQEGTEVFLKNSGNMRLGASATDVTDVVHPYNRFLACRIARILNLDVAGIDIISQDIAKPLDENNGKVIEVNAAPDFRMHMNPTFGTKRHVQQDFVSMLFPAGSQSGVPVYSVTGSKGKSMCLSIINTCLSEKGQKTGVISKNGLYIDGFSIKNSDATESVNVPVILKDPGIDCVLLETPVESILSAGLGYAYAHFGIILNLSDHKEEYFTYDHIRDIEDIAYAKMVVAEQLCDQGFAIINADEKLLMQMRSRIYAQLILFSKKDQNPDFSKHIANAGTGILLHSEQITIYDKGLELFVINTAEIPLLQQDPCESVKDAVLASIMALYLSDIPIGQIRQTLLTTSLKKNI